MMEKKNLPQPTDTIERMAAKIDEIYDRLNFIESLMSDLGPGLGKVAKDLSPTIKDLRELYERDETLTLIKKVGDNIPTFLTLLNLMGTVKGMLEDLAPAIQKISKDTQPTIKDLREKFEKDETLELIMKVGDNIPTFLTLLNLMGTVKGMLEDLAPAIQKISKDTQPTIRDLREKFEKDETLELIMKVGDNIPTFLTLLNLMGTVKGMLEDLAPAIQKISKDTQPTIRDLREKFERDETLELIMKLGDNIPVFVMLQDLLGKPEIHDFILKTIENIKIFRGLGDMLSVFQNFMNFLTDAKPFVDVVKEKLGRTETFELVLRATDNIPMLATLMELSGKQEVHDFIVKTLENIKIFRGLGDMLSVFDNLMNFLQELNKAKTIDYTTKILLSKEINYLIIGMDKCIFNAMKDIKENPIKPGIKNLISAVRDPEVQKGILIMTKFAKWLPGSLSEAEKEVDGIITGS